MSAFHRASQEMAWLRLCRFTNESTETDNCYLNLNREFRWLWYSVHVYVSYSGSITVTSVGEERELVCQLSFSCGYVVSVRGGFLFHCVLGMGCVILLWHSMRILLVNGTLLIYANHFRELLL